MTILESIADISVHILAIFLIKLTVMYFALRSVRSWQQITKATLGMYSASLGVLLLLSLLKIDWGLAIIFVGIGYFILAVVIEAIVAYRILRPIDENRIYASVSAANMAFWLAHFIFYWQSYRTFPF